MECELKELESGTEKKEKRLRKYFIENEVLIKYQLVHSNLTKTTEREISFIEDGRMVLRKQINALQKEILMVSESRI